MAIYCKNLFTNRFRWCFVALMLLTHLCCVAAGEQAGAACMPASMETPFQQPLFESLETDSPASMSAKLIDGNLLIASNDGQGTEMCYWFKRCMFNKLFTFFKVGYRSVDRTTSDTDGITDETGSDIIWLNSAVSSDNIGPVSIDDYGDFVGGNHAWRKTDEKGNKGKGAATKIFTAHCDSIAISHNGVALEEGQAIDCNSLDIEVFNTIFDPIVEPAPDATTLSVPLVNEVVHYHVELNSVEVTVSHTYAKDMVIRRYYGMQSMFINESDILTPSGPYRSWTMEAAVKSFKKASYPWFSHFLERSPSGWCQVSWMLNDGLGSHECITANSPIFVRSSNKCYHVLMDNHPVTKGSEHSWKGVYAWSLPLIDNPVLTLNKGRLNGRTLLIVDAKQGGSTTFQRPGWWTNFFKLVDSHGITIEVTDDQVTINSTKASSVILLELDDSDGIDDIRADVPTTTNQWYTMQGQRINTPQQPGIYIHNGKKVVLNH